MKKNLPPKVSGRHSKPGLKTGETTKQRVMTKLEVIKTSDDMPGEVRDPVEPQHNFNVLMQDLQDFQQGAKPLSNDLVNCLETQLRLLLAKKRNPSGPDFDPEPPPGGATALPVPTESKPTVVRMSA